MKKIFGTTHILLLSVFLTACIGTAKIQVNKNDFEPSSHRNYAWNANPIMDDGRNSGYAMLDKALRSNTDAELGKRNYKIVDKRDADFLVSYRFVQNINIDKGGLISPVDEAKRALDHGQDVNNTALHNHYIPAEVQHGVLELSFVDSKSGQEIWEATATKVIEDSLENEAAVTKAVKTTIGKMFNGFLSRQ